MKITKREVLKAIRTEPLKPGFWMHADKRYFKNCSVCAVGAVLRNRIEVKSVYPTMLVDVFNRKVCNIMDSESSNYTVSLGVGELDNILNQGLYLTALSNKFEALAEKYKTMRTVRKHLEIFVKKNFPKEFEVADYNDK